MSDVLDFFREKEARFSDVPDDKLTVFIGEKHPEFLKDESFNRQYHDTVARLGIQSAGGLTDRVAGIVSNPAAAIASDVGQQQAEAERPRILSPDEVGHVPTGEASTTYGGTGGPRFTSLSQLGADVAKASTTPPIPIPKFTVNKDDSPYLAAGKEAVNMLVGLPEFVETPQGMVAAAASMNPIGRKVVAGYFTQDMLRSFGKQVLEAEKDWGTLTPAEKSQRIVQIAGTGAMGLMTGYGTAHGIGPRVGIVDGKMEVLTPAETAVRVAAETLDKTKPELPSIEQAAVQSIPPINLLAVKAKEIAPVAPLTSKALEQSASQAVVQPAVELKGSVSEAAAVSPVAEKPVVAATKPADQSVSEAPVLKENLTTETKPVDQPTPQPAEQPAGSFPQSSAESGKGLAEGSAGSVSVGRDVTAEVLDDASYYSGENRKPTQQEVSSSGGLAGAIYGWGETAKKTSEAASRKPKSNALTKTEQKLYDAITDGVETTRWSKQLQYGRWENVEHAGMGDSAFRKTMTRLLQKGAIKLYESGRNLVVKKALKAEKEIPPKTEPAKSPPDQPTTPPVTRANEQGGKGAMGAVSKAAETLPKVTENLMIDPRTDGMVSLRDTGGNHIDTFKTAQEAGNWAAENGYGIAAGSPLKPGQPHPIKVAEATALAKQILAEYDFSQIKRKELYPRLHAIAYDVANRVHIGDSHAIGIVFDLAGKAVGTDAKSPYLGNVLEARRKEGKLNEAFRNPPAAEKTEPVDQSVNQPPNPPPNQTVERMGKGTTEGTRLSMGGATPEEFSPSGQTSTSAKNAIVDQERIARGEKAMMAALAREWPEVWPEAMARVDKDPSLPDRLTEELIANPRPISDVENAVMVYRRVELKNEYAKSTKEAAQAYDDAQAGFPDRMEAFQRHNAQTQYWSDQLLKWEQAMGKGGAGTEAGRALAARKMVANDDFSLAALELQKRADNGFRQLTDQERAELKKIADDYKRLSDEYDEIIKAHERNRVIEQEKNIFDQARLDAKKIQPYSPHVIKIAESIVANWDKAAEGAMARLRAKFGKQVPGDITTELHSGLPLDPSVITDLAMVGRSFLGHAALDSGKWGARMVERVGDWVKPHLEQVWAKTKELIASEEKSASEGSPKKQAIRKISSGTSFQEFQQAIIARIADKATKNKPFNLTYYARSIAARIVTEKGKIPAKQLVDEVHGVLTGALPELTRDQVMDALSMYGKTKPLDNSGVKPILRDLYGQMQQQAKIRDMQAGFAPKKTGPQRRIPSNEERELTKQGEELKRQGNYTVTDPERQLRTALDRNKTAVKNQIHDLETQIERREKFIKKKTASPTDPELEALKSRRDELKDTYDKVFAPPELTDAERLDLWKKRTQERIAEWEEKVRLGNIAPKPKPNPIVKDTEAIHIQYKLDTIKRTVYEMRAADKRKQWGKLKKVGYGGLEVLNTSRALMTSFDFSAVLRQGKFIGLAHPILAAKNFPAMFKAFASREQMFKIAQNIRNRENAPLYDQAKLYLVDHGGKLSQMEEAYMSRWIEATEGIKMPKNALGVAMLPIDLLRQGVASSQRAYNGYLNLLRADAFDLAAAKLSLNGTANLVEAKAIANFINVATGRGKIGFHDNVAVGMNAAFFAPRLVASRFQLLFGSPMWGGTMRTRVYIAKEYARFLTGAAVIYALGNYAGASVELDPRSSDFGKLKFGNVRIDPMAGLIQTTVLMSRAASGWTKTLPKPFKRAELQPLRGNYKFAPTRLYGKSAPKFGQSDTRDVIARFAWSKLAPTPGAIVNLLAGKDVVGNKYTLKDVPGTMFTPLSYQDVLTAMRQQGVPAGLAYGILSIFGDGMQTFSQQNPSKKADYH